MHCLLERVLLRRTNNILIAATQINPRQRSGVFAVGDHPEEDGIIGGSVYVRLWTGIAEADTLTDDLPPQTLITAFYFEDTLPYSWR